MMGPEQNPNRYRTPRTEPQQIQNPQKRTPMGMPVCIPLGMSGARALVYCHCPKPSLAPPPLPLLLNAPLLRECPTSDKGLIPLKETCLDGLQTQQKCKASGADKEWSEGENF